jgi:hypothetical protein
MKRGISMRQPRLRTVLVGTGAALALAAGNGFALASSDGAPHAGNAAGTSTNTAYRGCVEGSSRTLEHVYTRTSPPSCPSGSFAATWNQQGPQGIQGPPGPAGVVTGYAASGDGAALSGDLTTVDTLNLPSGDFLLTAMVSIYYSSLTTEDYTPCVLFDGSGAVVDASFSALHPGNLGGDQTTLSLAGATTVGGTIQLQCLAGQQTATAIHPVITAVPVAAVSGATNHPQHLPPLRSGAAAGPQRG